MTSTENTPPRNGSAEGPPPPAGSAGSAPPQAGSGAAGPLTPTDLRAFAFLGHVNGCLRQCLCTLARHGVALRRRDPERARALLDAVRPWPLYKGGQFLFDLMEWEDLMVDGDPPPLMTTERITAAWTLPVQWIAATAAQTPAVARRIPGQRTAAALDLPLRLLATTARTALLGAAQDLTGLLTTPAPATGEPTATDGEPSATDGADGEPTAASTAPAPDPEDPELPPLEGGFYLYEDIALGTLTVLGPLLSDHAPTGTAPPA